MEFDYIVGSHKGTDEVIGGFLKLSIAKEYAKIKNLNYIGIMYMYVDAPEGRYILGNDKVENKYKWYAPGEKAYVYDCTKGEVIEVEMNGQKSAQIP